MQKAAHKSLIFLLLQHNIFAHPVLACFANEAGESRELALFVLPPLTKSVLK